MKITKEAAIIPQNIKKRDQKCSIDIGIGPNFSGTSFKELNDLNLVN